MIQINLMPVRARKKKENIRQFISIYFLSVVLLGCAMGYFWMTMRSEIQSLDRRLNQLKSEVSQYAKFDVMLKELKKKKETIDKKRNVIQGLQDDRDRVVRMLAMLSVETPSDKISFERLSLTGNSVTLNGIALSNEAIAEFMRNLEFSPYIEKGSVNLVLSRQVEKSTMKLREFQLAYRFFPFSVVEKKLQAEKAEPQAAGQPPDKT
jgi:type IV pilus assembly protein PilN